MNEFTDMIGHTREYEFTAPAEAYPHRRLVDPLQERRQRYMAQGRTYTEAGDLAVLAAVHKQFTQYIQAHRAETDQQNQRIAELEARVQQLTNLFAAKVESIPELDEAERELALDEAADFLAADQHRKASQTLIRLSAAQERKRRRAQRAAELRKQAADDKLRKQYRKAPRRFGVALPADTMAEVKRAVRRITEEGDKRAVAPKKAKKKAPAKKAKRRA